MHALGIVLKTTERCNLDCTYCYFFNGKDQSFKRRPARISRETILKIISFLTEGIQELSLEALSIGFHGGEPLLQNQEDFSWMCEQFLEKLGHIKLKFTLQTNGTLINEKWIKLFHRYHVDVGISVDGSQQSHDQNWVDFQGRGTYQRVFEKISLMKEQYGNFGILSVIHPEYDGKVLYWHFVDVFDAWVGDDNPEIGVRFLNSYLGLMLGQDALIYGIGAFKNKELPLISIRSDGDLSPTDELMSTDPATVTWTGKNVATTSLKQFLNLSIFQEIEKAQRVLPQVCRQCCWEKICGGGGIVNRFSHSKRFHNPSVYCAGLKDFYAHILAYLLKSGVSFQKISPQIFSSCG